MRRADEIGQAKLPAIQQGYYGGFGVRVLITCPKCGSNGLSPNEDGDMECICGKVIYVGQEKQPVLLSEEVPREAEQHIEPGPVKQPVLVKPVPELPPIPPRPTGKAGKVYQHYYRQNWDSIQKYAEVYGVDKAARMWGMYGKTKLVWFGSKVERETGEQTKPEVVTPNAKEILGDLIDSDYRVFISKYYACMKRNPRIFNEDVWMDQYCALMQTDVLPEIIKGWATELKSAVSPDITRTLELVASYFERIEQFYRRNVRTNE